jgi:hypothetical protein
MHLSTKESASRRPPTAGTRAAGTAAIAAAAAVVAAVALFTGPGAVSPFVEGERDHDRSGLSLAAAGTTVDLTDFVTDPGTSVLTGTVSVDGEVAAEDAPLFFLDGRTLNPLEMNDNGTAVLEGTTVKMEAEAADL